MFNPISLAEKFLESLFPQKSHAYSAKFASSKTLLSKRGSGFMLNGKHSLSKKHSYQNAVIIGSTGTGKSTTCLIPSILSMTDSMVIHDPSGELLTKTALSLRERGFSIKVFNPAQPKASNSFNFLSYISSSSEIHKSAATLIRATNQNKNEPFWDQLAVSLLSIFMRALKHGPVRFQNLLNLVHLLTKMGLNHNQVTEYIKSTEDQNLLDEYLAFLNYDEKVVSGVLATCKATLQFMTDDDIQLVTGVDSMNLKRIRKEKTAIFIQNSISDQHYYAPLTSLFFEVLFSQLLSELPTKENGDVFLLLDEASSLTCPTLPLALANLRKYRVGILLALQNHAQLETIYGKIGSESIMSNCLTKVFYSGQNTQAAKELEYLLGDYEYVNNDGFTQKRPLLTHDEIRQISNNRALVISGNTKPVLIKLFPFFTRRRFKKTPEIRTVTSRTLESVQLPILELQEYGV